MASNVYFNNYNRKSEQDLFEDLTVESIRQYAHDMVYMPAEDTDNAVDNVMNEYRTIHFNKAIDVEMYIQSFNSFEGQGELLSKFSFEIRDEVILVLSDRSFNEFIAAQSNRVRPNEGDAIYIPMLNAVYRIMRASKDVFQWYAFGKVNVWQLRCELIEYDNQKFNTGRTDIDSLYTPFENVETNPDYNIENYDLTAKNNIIQDESAFIINMDEINGVRGEE